MKMNGTLKEQIKKCTLSAVLYFDLNKQIMIKKNPKNINAKHQQFYILNPVCSIAASNLL